jgi:predicted esterase
MEFDTQTIETYSYSSSGSSRLDELPSTTSSSDKNFLRNSAGNLESQPSSVPSSPAATILMGHSQGAMIAAVVLARLITGQGRLRSDVQLAMHPMFNRLSLLMFPFSFVLFLSLLG